MMEGVQVSQGEIEKRIAQPLQPARTMQFPLKLHLMLNEANGLDFEDVVCWTSDGKAFQVLDKAKFERQVMPRYFTSAKFTAFQRSLNLWDFKSSSGKDRKGNAPNQTGGLSASQRYHPLFQRGKPELCFSMKRVRVRDPGARSNAPDSPRIQSKGRETVSDLNDMAKIVATRSKTPPLVPPGLGLIASVAAGDALAHGGNKLRPASSPPMGSGGASTAYPASSLLGALLAGRQHGPLHPGAAVGIGGNCPLLLAAQTRSSHLLSIPSLSSQTLRVLPSLISPSLLPPPIIGHAQAFLGAPPNSATSALYNLLLNEEARTRQSPLPEEDPPPPK